MNGSKVFTATANGRSVTVRAVSACKAIKTGAKILGVKMNKVAVRQ